jgi:pimeloyl-ACP methyl ester carboxylesterase
MTIVAERFVTSFDGTSIWFSDSGGDGAVVVLLHGATLTSISNFRVSYSDDGAISSAVGPTVHGRLVAAGARVIGVDARGHGRSGRSREPDRYRGDAHAHDVTAVLDAAGVDQVDLVGYSMGSLTAMRLFSLDSRIRSAALCGAGLHFLDGHADANLEYLRDVGECLRSNGWSEHPEYLWVRELAELDDVHDFESIGAALIGFEPVEQARLADASFPVLVLNGGADEGDAAGLAELLPQARAVIAGPRDHASAYRDDEFQGALLDFVTDNWLSSS